jgi:sulfur-oxidizing protein SoxY
MDNAMDKQRSPRSGRTRRTIIKGAVAGGLAGLGLAPSRSAAADAGTWPKDAFAQKTEAAAIKALYGGKAPQASDKVNLDAPEIAENGAVVPISVSTTLPDVTSIAIVVSGNPFPLAASYVIAPDTSAMVANRLKMAKTSKVLALVESGGKVFSASKEVKVTVGGCGG